MPGTTCTSGKVVEHSAWNRRLSTPANSPKGSLHAQPQEPRCFTFIKNMYHNCQINLLVSFEVSDDIYNSWIRNDLPNASMTSRIAKFMGQTWALGPVGPRWAPCWPHDPCYQEIRIVTRSKLHNCPWHCTQHANNAIMFMPLLHSYS